MASGSSLLRGWPWHGPLNNGIVMVMLMSHTRFCAHLFMTSVFMLATGCADNESGEVIVIVGADVGVEDGGANRDDSCESAVNGWCDEPAVCALGTDDTDCFEACEAGGTSMAFIAAACAHRNLLENQGAGSTERRPMAQLWFDEVLPAPTPSGGQESRHFRVFVPPGLPTNTLVPLVLMLPGNRVSHYSGPDYTELDRTAAREGFIVAYVEQPWRNETFSWSWYTDWDWADDASGNPDVRFLESLVDYLVGQQPIDPEKVYVAGHSRGGAMSIIAALEKPNIFAGAIPQSGFVEFGYFERILNWSGEVRPAFYFMHGTLDDDVCIDCEPGGMCGIQPGRRCGTVASSDLIVETLRERGWDEDHLAYARIENVAHRWQPWLNETWWSFMALRASEVRR